jgi:hypothetical protein
MMLWKKRPTEADGVLTARGPIAREVRFLIWATAIIYALLLAMILAGLAFVWKQSHDRAVDNRRQFESLCSITDAFITANLILQNAQSKATIQAIGLRWEVIAAAERAIRLLTTPPLRIRRDDDASLLFYQATATLNRVENESAVAVQVAREKAANKVRKLRRDLQCES